MEESGHLYAPTALPPGKELEVPIGQEAGLASHRGSGRGGEEEGLNPYLKGNVFMI
jgi:hypothetical protein